MLRVGLFINPIAGCGQFLNLKGSDSLTLSMCPRSISFEKAVEFLTEVRDTEAFYYTASGYMGEDALKTAGVVRYKVIYNFTGDSTRLDTAGFLQSLEHTDAELLVFFGGDGTARDIVDSGYSKPVLGVPLGTKMFSSVFAISVVRAAQVFIDLAKGKSGDYTRADVIDMDEASYALGSMDLSTYGSILIPRSEYIMSESKAEYPATSAESIAQYIIDRMEPGVNYVVGPGSTCKKINSLLNLESSLLGFDLIRDKALMKQDLSESEIFALTDERTVVILSPIGGQGFLIGRGNKQLTGRIVSRVGFDNIIVVSSEEKLRSLRGLYLDLNNLTVEKPKFVRVLFSYGRFKMMPALY